MVRERTFQDGEVFFAQGEASRSVYVIKAGRVDVVRKDGAEEHVIAHLAEGDVLGEVAAIAAQPHLATARAVGPVIAEEIPTDGFLRHLEEKPAAALPILRALVERLRAADLRLDLASEPVAWREMRLRPLGDVMARQLPPGGLAIHNLPFRVGRRPHNDEIPSDGARPIHLILDDEMSAQVDRDHFVIEDSAMGPILRDCGSRRGTVVNGIPLGGAHRHLSTPLRLGVNRVTIGAPGSPFQFELSVLAQERRLR